MAPPGGLLLPRMQAAGRMGQASGLRLDAVFFVPSSGSTLGWTGPRDIGSRTGQTYVASVLAANPAAPLAPDSATLTLISAVKGALQLAAG